MCINDPTTGDLITYYVEMIKEVSQHINKKKKDKIKKKTIKR